MSVKFEKRSGQRDKSSVLKKFQIFRLFRRKLAAKSVRRKVLQHAAQRNGVLSFSAKTLAFLSLL